MHDGKPPSRRPWVQVVILLLHGAFALCVWWSIARSIGRDALTGKLFEGMSEEPDYLWGAVMVCARVVAGVFCSYLLLAGATYWIWRYHKLVEPGPAFRPMSRRDFRLRPRPAGLKALMALGCLFTGSAVLEALMALASALAECLLGWGWQMALVLAGFFLLTGVPVLILAAAASAAMVLGYPVCRHLCGYIRASLAGKQA